MSRDGDRLLLDTHILVYWIDRLPQLRKEDRRRIAEAAFVGVSAWTFWELTHLVRLGRLEAGRSIEQWLDVTRDDERLEIIDVNPVIAMGSVDLLPQHEDAGDCLIIATAIERNLTLVSHDKVIRGLGVVPTIGRRARLRGPR